MTCYFFTREKVFANIIGKLAAIMCRIQYFICQRKTNKIGFLIWLKYCAAAVTWKNQQPTNHGNHSLIRLLIVSVRFHLWSFLWYWHGPLFPASLCGELCDPERLIWRVHGSINMPIDRFWGFHGVVILPILRHELFAVRRCRARSPFTVIN